MKHPLFGFSATYDHPHSITGKVQNCIIIDFLPEAELNDVLVIMENEHQIKRIDHAYLQLNMNQFNSETIASVRKQHPLFFAKAEKRTGDADEIFLIHYQNLFHSHTLTTDLEWFFVNQDGRFLTGPMYSTDFIENEISDLIIAEKVNK